MNLGTASVIGIQPIRVGQGGKVAEDGLPLAARELAWMTYDARDRLLIAEYSVGHMQRHLTYDIEKAMDAESIEEIKELGGALAVVSGENGLGGKMPKNGPGGAFGRVFNKETMVSLYKACVEYKDPHRVLRTVESVEGVKQDLQRNLKATGESIHSSSLVRAASAARDAANAVWKGDEYDSTKAEKARTAAMRANHNSLDGACQLLPMEFKNAMLRFLTVEKKEEPPGPPRRSSSFSLFSPRGQMKKGRVRGAKARRAPRPPNDWDKARAAGVRQSVGTTFPYKGGRYRVEENIMPNKVPFRYARRVA